MGTRTLSQLGERLGILSPDNADRRPLRMPIDVPLLIITISLVVFGLLMVYSASADFSYRLNGQPMYFFKRQIGWVIVGLIIAIGLSFANYHWWRKLALPAMAVVLIGLIIVLFVRDERFGAARSLSGGSYQPSELAKLMLIIYLSVWLFNRRDNLRDANLALFPLGIILGVLGGFIALQPDLSAVLTLAILGGLLFFLAGGDLKQILILLGLGFGVGFLIANSNIFPTGRQRIDDYINGLKNLLESSPHVQRSLEAFVKGGLFGVGIGKGTTKVTGLPFPHTDSIFAVIGEETGLLGSSMLVLLYVGLLWRGLTIANRAPDGLGRLMASGLVFWIGLEACINMAVMVGLMPFAGNALPFISSGGSSMLVSLAAVGILMNIARQGELKEVIKESQFGAVVDLRRGDGRRRVSRSRRSSSPAIRE